MRRALARIIFSCLAALIAAGPISAQQTTDTFRWIDFHAAEDQNIVAWISRSLELAKWTNLREIGVVYDAALVVTDDRTDPQSAPGAETFTIWTASLTAHDVVPLVTGVNLRWFNPVRFADDARDEWPILYDNCRDCQPNTYFTAFYFDLSTHKWAARWMTGGHGISVWNVNRPGGTQWAQVYALLSNGVGHMALYTWNHFDYPKPRPAQDYIYRYDLDPFSHLERNVALSEKQTAGLKTLLCRAETAPPGLARGQDSPFCEDLIKKLTPRQPVTTPPGDNRGQSAPPGASRATH